MMRGVEVPQTFYADDTRRNVPIYLINIEKAKQNGTHWPTYSLTLRLSDRFQYICGIVGVLIGLLHLGMRGMSICLRE
jgi:hypothetical protein